MHSVPKPKQLVCFFTPSCEIVHTNNYAGQEWKKMHHSPTFSHFLGRVHMGCSKYCFWGSGALKIRWRSCSLGKMKTTLAFWRVWVCLDEEGELNSCLMMWHLMLCSLTGHPSSWGVPREVPEALEDMGWPAASVLVPSLPVHMCTRVFLVHASAVCQATRLVPGFPIISFVVSTQGWLTSCPNATAMQVWHFSLFSSRVWLLRKMLIMIFSLITEKNSKDDFATIIHNLKWFDVKAFFWLIFFFPPRWKIRRSESKKKENSKCRCGVCKICIYVYCLCI